MGSLSLALLGLAACSVYDASLLPDNGPDGAAGTSPRNGSSSGAQGGAAGSLVSNGTGGSATTGGAAGDGGSSVTEGTGGSESTDGTGGSSVSGNGGSSGFGGSGTPFDAGSEAGLTGICSYSNPITLLYRNWRGADAGAVVDFSFKIINGSVQSIALSTLTVRYYLSNEIGSAVATAVYGDVCCPDSIITSHVKASVQPLSPPASGADAYVEITFDSTSGSLAAARMLDVEVEFKNAIGSVSDQTNDYSYIATATGTQSLWDNCPTTGNCAPFHSCLMTVHQNGTLIWGTAPNITAADPRYQIVSSE